MKARIGVTRRIKETLGEQTIKEARACNQILGGQEIKDSKGSRDGATRIKGGDWNVLFKYDIAMRSYILEGWRSC
jgi:hypothetical protein